MHTIHTTADDAFLCHDDAARFELRLSTDDVPPEMRQIEYKFNGAQGSITYWAKEALRMYNKPPGDYRLLCFYFDSDYESFVFGFIEVKPKKHSVDEGYSTRLGDLFNLRAATYSQ